MRTGIVITVAGVFSLNALAAGAATNGVSPSVRKAILSNYDSIDAAISSKGLDKIYSYLTPNYVFHMRGVSYSISTLRQMQAQVFAESGAMTSTTRVQNMTLHGRGVVATITQYATEALVNAKGNRIEKDGFLYREQDFWVNTPFGWRIQSTQVLSETDTVDGRPIDNDRSPNSPDIT